VDLRIEPNGIFIEAETLAIVYVNLGNPDRDKFLHDVKADVDGKAVPGHDAIIHHRNFRVDMGNFHPAA
jgi:hypothetical protein